jgi:hypothetical protein
MSSSGSGCSGFLHELEGAKTTNCHLGVTLTPEIIANEQTQSKSPEIH